MILSTEECTIRVCRPGFGRMGRIVLHTGLIRILLLGNESDENDKIMRWYPLDDKGAYCTRFIFLVLGERISAGATPCWVSSPQPRTE